MMHDIFFCVINEYFYIAKGATPTQTEPTIITKVEYVRQPPTLAHKLGVKLWISDISRTPFLLYAFTISIAALRALQNYNYFYVGRSPSYTQPSTPYETDYRS